VDWKSYLAYADPGTTKPYRGDSLDMILARRLHDTPIAAALDELLMPICRQEANAQKGIVAIMGGHDLERREKVNGSQGSQPAGDEAWEGMTDDTIYTRVALLAWRLTNDPGAMEATNLGAYFATRSLIELRTASRKLQDFPFFVSGKSTEWLKPAMEVTQQFPLEDRTKCQSVGISTVFYGYEPPHVFGTHIAKYFENSVREEGMLAIANNGVIFADGNPTTVQEMFQDACQKYYGTAAPMLLFGEEYWDSAVMPVYVNDKRKKALRIGSSWRTHCVR
jgi:hypothetical protein